MSYVKVIYIKDLLAIFGEPLLFIISALILLPIVLSISAARANRIRSPLMRNFSKQLNRAILIFVFIIWEMGFISLLAGKIFYRPIAIAETLKEKKA